MKIVFNALTGKTVVAGVVGDHSKASGLDLKQPHGAKVEAGNGIEKPRVMPWVIIL